MRKLAHIVTPVIVPESSDLFLAQPITFETMRMAKRFAENAGAPSVALYAANFAEDAPLAPEDFIQTPLLDRSILDVGKFEISLKLPFIADILSRLHAAAKNADYLIYTNVDIGLLPNFYVTVDRLIERGFDAFTINPRRVPAHYTDLADIPLMWAEGDKFRQGWDCFVFRRDAFPQFRLENACVGVVNIGRVLILNLVMTARNFAEYTDLHLTFHIGNEGRWRRTPMRDYAAHNLAVVQRLLDSLKSRNALSLHPVITRMIEKMKANGQLEPDY
jgi:hypothetical protein